MEEVPEKAQKAIDALLGGATISEAAKASGLNRKTVAKLLHTNPAFRAQLAKGRDAIRSAVIDRVLGLQNLALDTLALICRSGKIDAQTRVAAARAILQAANQQAGSDVVAPDVAPADGQPTRVIHWRLMTKPPSPPAAPAAK